MTLYPNQDPVGKLPEWQIADSSVPPALLENELHLWFMPLCLTTEQQSIAVQLLNETQLDKYRRRHTPALQQAYLAGRYHLMNMLGAYNEMPADQVKLSYSRLNKPYLNPNPSDIQFNFTDTKSAGASVALYVFTKSKAVGVDIESLARRSNFAAIVKQRFSAAETAYVTDKNGSIDPRRFLAYWTRKEAYGKATGQGINFKMNEMDLASPSSFELEFESAAEPSNLFSLQQIQISQQLISTVVHQGHRRLTIRALKCVNHLP